MRNDLRIAYAETLSVIDNMDPKYKAKIPEKLIELFEKNKAENYEFKINLGIPLKEQKLNRKTLNLLAMIDLNYWCETEEEKKALSDKFKENERRYAEEQKKRYEQVFGEKEIKTNARANNVIEYEAVEEAALIEVKESFWKKIINKIKTLFDKN